MRVVNIIPARALIALLVPALVLATAPIALGARDRTAPTRPTNLHVTAVTTTSASLAWGPSTDNSGAFSYVVRRGDGQTRSVAQSSTAFTWTALVSDTSYSFVVYAIDGAGNRSSDSNPVTARTLKVVVLPAPANLRVTSTAARSIALAWDAVPGAVSYELSRNGLGVASTSLVTATDPGLVPSTTYAYRVRAIDAAGTASAWSGIVSATTLPETTTPIAPVITGTPLGPSKVRLHWAADTNPAAWGSGYNVSVNGLPARSMLPIDALPWTVEIENLRSGVAYDFSVKAYNAAGEFSPPSNVLTITMPAGTDTIPPPAPTNLRLLAPAGKSTVQLGWDHVPDNVGVHAYDVYVDGSFAAEVRFDVHYGGLDTVLTLRNLAPGSTHSFTVRARDASGNVSAESNPIVATLQPSTDVTPPTAPVILWGHSNAGCAFVDFAWAGAIDDVDSGWDVAIELFEDGLSIGVWKGEVHEASFGRHVYTLKAIDRSGNASPASNALVLDNELNC